MASLIADAAAIRAQSKVLRADGDRLRVVSRRRMRATRDRLQESQELCALMQARRRRGIPTAWSNLRWGAPDGALDLVLELLEAA